MNMDLANIFWNEVLAYAKHNTSNSSLTGHRRFSTLYAISPQLCSILWNLITDKPPKSEPKHFLWCMMFLKNYHKEHVNGADEKTFRLWAWRFVELLSQLDVVGIN